jgi:uncharacterized protein (DUF2235 family)
LAKNIVVFSDGTGQDGGARLDARLSNVYKLFRASRSGADSAIDPSAQIAFYDPGLGTDSDSHGIGRLGKTIYKWAASVAGRGIATNIADCYEFIINHWQPGDRIFLFGFSRGAYTARCVAQLVSLCGVPTHASNTPGEPFKRFGRGARKVAELAVHKVYEHGAGYPRAQYETEREELARRFRLEFGSDQTGKANACPHFIGVFDTVAALGAAGWKRRGIIAGLTVASLLMIAVAIGPFAWFFGWRFWLAFLVAALAVGAVSLMILRHDSYRYIDNFPAGTRGRKGHHIRWEAANYDRGLSKHVGYARQASAIDETRADFPRVQWGANDVIRPRQPGEPDPMIQLYFAGNHSDIGGSYPEPESRLSDVALQWMVAEATAVPHPLLVERDRVRAFPDPSGMQHDETQSVRENDLWWMPKWFPKALRQGWAETYRIANGFPMHPSVHQRFAGGLVDYNGTLAEYRPYNLRNDPRFASYYGKTDPAQATREARQKGASYDAGGTVFSLGAPSKTLAALLKSHDATSAAGIFPGNPEPDPDSAYTDALALRMLGTCCDQGRLAAMALKRLPASAGGIAEEGLLIMDVDNEAARRLARAFGATTLIAVDASGNAELVALVP